MNLTPDEPRATPSPFRRLWPVVLVLLAVACGLFLFRPDRSKPHPLPPDLELALTLLKDHKVERAEQVLKDVLSAEPDSVTAADELRWLYFYEFRERDVERLLDEQLAKFPDRHVTLYHAMMTEFRKQTPREGLGRLHEIEAAHPGQRPVIRALAYCDWHLGQLEAAQERFSQALAADPNDHETLLMLTEFSLEQNQLASAEKFLKRIDLPDDDRPHWLRSLLAERQGDLDRALSEAEEASQLRPYELKYVYQTGSLLQRLGKSDSAKQAFELAKQIETAQQALSEVVLSGEIEQIEPQLCRKLAEHNRLRRRTDHADAWERLAVRIERGELR